MFVFNVKITSNNTNRPCKMISPVFAQLASQNPEAVFVKVDVDVNKPIAKRYGISGKFF